MTGPEPGAAADAETAWQDVGFEVTDRIAGASRMTVSVPPGWWLLPLGAGDSDEVIAAYVMARTPPELREPMFAELQRLAHAASLAGAVLIGIGTAVDDQTAEIITASLMLAPLRVVDDAPPAGRSLALGTSSSIFGEVRLLAANFVVADRWWLCLQTPALGHAETLVAVFDDIASQVRVAPTVGVADAFSA